MGKEIEGNSQEGNPPPHFSSPKKEEECPRKAPPVGGYRPLVRTGGFPLQIGIPKFPTLSATLSPPPTSLHFAAGIGRCRLGDEEERTTPLCLGPFQNLTWQHRTSTEEQCLPLRLFLIVPFAFLLTPVDAAFNTYHPPLLPLFSLLLLVPLLRLTSSLEKGNFCGGHERAVGENGRDR